MSNGWNGYAKEFNELATFDKQSIHTGLGLRGIEPKEVVCHAESILDVGCGEGTNTYLMYSVGKVKTVGIDIASSAIDKANKQYAEDVCTFLNCDISGFLKKYDGDPFGLVTFWGSLDYLKLDEEFFNKLNYITKVGSRCFVSKFHPMWTALYGNDVEDQCMRSYFDDGRVDLVPYGVKNKVFLERIHYSISYIYSAFKKGGWDVKKIEEPKPDLENSSFKYLNYDSDDILMDRMGNVPMTIIFEFERRR